MEPDVEWQRLPPKAAIVQLLGVIYFVGYTGGTAFIVGSAFGLSLWIVLIPAGLFVASSLLNPLRTFVVRFRVLDDRVEVKSGLVVRAHVKLRRELIRTVDSTANLFHRLFGLRVVKIGTGEQARLGDSGVIVLDAVSAAVADALRVQLLDRSTPTWSEDAPPVEEHAVGQNGSADPARETPIELASLRWRWLPYSFASWWVLLFPLGAVNSLMNLDATTHVSHLISWFYTPDHLSSSMVVGVAVFTILGGVFVGCVVRAVGFIGGWWSYYLHREPHGAIRLQRGLFSTKSITLDEARIRGVEFAEDWPLRAARGSRVDVITTGIKSTEETKSQAGSTSLAPAIPFVDAARIAGQLLEEPDLMSIARAVHRHPPAALHRRLIRSVWVSLCVGAVGILVARATHQDLGTSIVLSAGIGLWVVASAVMVVAAITSARALGHAITARWIVTRSGAFTRRTAVLARTNLVGVTVSASVFQRRAGLMSIAVTTPAGRSAYSIIDVDQQRGLEIASHATTGLIDQFLEPATSD